MTEGTQSSPDLSDVDSTPLVLDDLFDVKRELVPVSANWKNIGIALRLSPLELNTIETANHHDPTACLTSMVTQWLNKNYNVEKFGEPTWRWLVEAVGDPAGGANMAIASNIARSHAVGQKQVVTRGESELNLLANAGSGTIETDTGETSRKRMADSRTEVPATKIAKIEDPQQSTYAIPPPAPDSKFRITNVQQNIRQGIEEYGTSCSSDTTRDQPPTIMVDEECVKEIKKLVKKRPLVLVTAGIPGAGKSTLVKNLRGCKGAEAAKSGRKSVTRSVSIYEGEIHGLVSLRIIDMPGLEAKDLSSKEEEEELAKLSELTDGKADLLLYCMKMTDRADYRVDRIVKTLTKTFGKEIWRHTILVLTFGDVVLNQDEEDRDLLEEFTKDFEQALKKAGVSDIPVKSILSTQNIESDHEVQHPEIIGVPVGKHTHTPPNWAGSLMKEIIKKCKFDAIPAMLVLQGMQPGWVAKVLMKAGAFGMAAAAGFAIGGLGGVVGAALAGSILAGSGWGIEQLANIIKARKNEEVKEKTK